MAAPNRDYEIADLLERTWQPFFGRFGTLTEVQRSSITALFAGEDALICSPTASGKTEAVCAPLVERNLVGNRPWTILYISPTRALVNDLYERLTGPLAQLDVQVVRRTGDHKEFPRGSNVLLTTPESFDSLLCRGRSSGVIGQVRAVVLDEIHLLFGKARGEQLKWLLERLRQYDLGRRRVATSFQTVAVSATVPDPKAIVDAYLPAGRIFSVPGGREIRAVAVDSNLPLVEEALPAYLAQGNGVDKILVFCNARKRVDKLAVAMRPLLGPLGYSVRAHHGSLAAPERESAEKAMKTGSKVVLFSTSTLEIGIDIGNIDLIVLDAPAPDLSALLQRMGRGNRRTNHTLVMTCSGDLTEVLIHSAMLSAVRDGDLGPVDTGPHYAVARQQIASRILQGESRSTKRSVLEGLVSICCPDLSARELIDHLIESSELEEDGAGVRLGDYWRDLASRGAIHSNIEASGGSLVVDDDTGQPIAIGVRFQGGRGMQIGGNMLNVRRWDQFQLDVKRVQDLAASTGVWGYASRAWVQGSGQPYAVRKYLGIDPDWWPVLQQPWKTAVFHFGGVRRQAILELLFSTIRGIPAGVTVTPWLINFPWAVTSKPEWIQGANAQTLKIAIDEHFEALEHTLGRPYANKNLPRRARVEEVAGWLNVDSEAAAIVASEWRLPEDLAGPIVGALGSLAHGLANRG